MSEVIVPLEHGVECSDDAEDLGWQDRALCAQTDPEAFFPEKGGSTREAKKVCRGCEVRAECLEFALENDERFGIWGGMSERERRRLKREAVLALAPSAPAPAGRGPAGRARPGPQASGLHQAARAHPGSGESVPFGMTRIDRVRIHSQQLGEFLDHHVEDQLAQFILVFRPGQQRPPVQHDPRRP